MSSPNLSLVREEEMTATGALSYEMFRIIYTVIIVLTIIVSFLGIMCNIFTIIVYVKMGFSETTTISLTALAISDIGVDATAIVPAIFYILPPSMLFPLTSETGITTFGYPHHALVKTSAMITTFLCVERFLCVYWPLRIRRVFTHRRTLIAMVVLPLITIPPIIVIYFQYPMGWRYFPEHNATLIGILSVNDATIALCFLIYQGYSSVLLPIFTFVTVITCTTLLAFSLRKSQQWRNSNTSSTTSSQPVDHKADQRSIKEARVVKMVVALALVFIVSSIPSSSHMIAVMVVPGFQATGRYWDLFLIGAGAYFVADAANTSANVFIYFNMSTRFRQSARELSPWNKENTKKIARD